MFKFSQHINHPLAIQPTTNTQTPILHNAQPYTPTSPTHLLDSLHACINSPDQYLPPSNLSTFNLIPLTFSETNYSDDIACRKCGSNINFNMLLKISDHIPKGGQIFCAACLLMMASRKRDNLVDYFHKTLE